MTFLNCLRLCGLALPLLGCTKDLSANNMNMPCANISGEYSFLGEWIDLKETSTKGVVRNSLKQSQPHPRMDRLAGLHIESKTDPRSVRILFDAMTGQANIEVLGEGVIAPRVPSTQPASINVFVCLTGEWKKTLASKVGTSESGSQSTQQNVSLSLDEDGNLVSKGEYQNDSGIFFRDSYTAAWRVKFLKTNY